MAKFGWNAKSIIRGFSPIFHDYEILISLECAVDSEWNDVTNFIVLCSFVELSIRRNHKTQLWRSKANNIIQHYFHWQSTTFSWPNTNFDGQKLHIFIFSTCFCGQNMLRIGMQTYFHGQSATFSWARYNVFMGKLNCVLSPHACCLTSVVLVYWVFSLRRKWAGWRKGLAR